MLESRGKGPVALAVSVCTMTCGWTNSSMSSLREGSSEGSVAAYAAAREGVNVGCNRYRAHLRSGIVIVVSSDRVR